MAETIQLHAQVPDDLRGARLDQVAAQLFPDYSRARLQQWIKEGVLTVDGEVKKPRDKLIGGEQLALAVEVENEERWEAEAIALDIVYEDQALLVINKPAGLVVHPGAGNGSGTLLNAILHHYPDSASVPRAGIVHRLDKDTSGLMVVAKTLAAQNHLVNQLQDRTVHREYEAVCMGRMTGGGTVDEPLARHPKQRKKMAVSAIGGKEAITHYRVIQRYGHHTHVRCMLETGRTHQIRVHMAHIKYPLVGDPMYAGRPRIPKGASNELIDTLRGFGRQALHARRLELIHPDTDEEIAWEVDLPADMQQLLVVLNEHDS
ncbi:23S rRNA pseudouridine(1911/1915/1917) synthase RluD [Dasania sp. GY-MA-18]|uniref:Pseudouridine synthase n=1 Tax=Dasania phycosphaerae TaxID=2950436 RepID=A0A9J6RPB7_9GAMM|nr:MULTISPECIES: 23S rRNA pseudouridine(1911/1915/1917) synthase RluD [Dasania]MCR8923590.1 23S rRNA pseudouridine(1911/1915/1917) synthase RluD [Dasania sp. GY-MA-18]MCZ0866024.1 23S rRNA pseudouridine(1911/1915/1917) synthase RluD [Dasania phycosphaerae]MCZ0869748.1 23S rRNA pseudouridine(1911/1915/1917) synthase RluD [Dasania phycosphaerae]